MALQGLSPLDFALQPNQVGGLSGSMLGAIQSGMQFYPQILQNKFMQPLLQQELQKQMTTNQYLPGQMQAENLMMGMNGLSNLLNNKALLSLYPGLRGRSVGEAIQLLNASNMGQQPESVALGSNTSGAQTPNYRLNAAVQQPVQQAVQQPINQSTIPPKVQNQPGVLGWLGNEIKKASDYISQPATSAQGSTSTSPIGKQTNTNPASTVNQNPNFNPSPQALEYISKLNIPDEQKRFLMAGATISLPNGKRIRISPDGTSLQAMG